MTHTTTVITGASGGIGEGLARRLAAERHQLVLVARRESELQRVASDAAKLGSPGAIVVPADVTVRADLEHVRDAAIAAFGGFDVWVNNAGRGITRSVLDISGEDLADMITVNVTSALYGMQIAAEHFLERDRGHILNVSSFLGRVPMALPRSAYNAAKAALNSLTANMRVELKARSPNVHVTLVMPGMVATEFALNAVGAPPDAKVYAGGHVQTVEQVAGVIAAAIANPVAEVYTNPASADMARRYYADVAAYEAQAGNPWAAAPAP